MGIQQLTPIVQILFPDATVAFDCPASGLQYDVFALDLNGILYSLVSRAQSDENLILEVIKYIDHIIQMVPPQYILFLALDGSAPLGKLKTSAERRANYNVQKLRFTPGTTFMVELKKALCLYAGRFLTQSKYVKVIVSGSDREGEGEYKIFEYLKHWRTHEPQLALEKQNLKCLVLETSDTDMILFSLLSAGDLEIDLLRVDGPQKALTSVNRVKQSLLKGLVGEPSRLILDWCFLTVLSGTDFAPRLGGFDYRKVYAFWRQFKSDPSHEARYMIEPLHNGSFELKIKNFEEILKGSNFVDLHYLRLQIATERKNRMINLSPSDWKCNWNTLKQAFCSDIKFEVQTSKISMSTGSHSYFTQIFWTMPTSGERVLAGEGSGINPRTSEYFASFATCMPSSSIMVHHIRYKMSKEHFEALSSAIEQVSSSGLSSVTEEGKPKLKTRTISPNYDEKLSKTSSISIPSSSSDTSAASSPIQHPKRVYALTKYSKTIDDCPEACNEILKSAFWMLNLLRAELSPTFGTAASSSLHHFYPFNLVPSVDAMQLYLSQMSETQNSIQWNHPFSSSSSLSSSSSNSSSSSSILPSIQYLFMLSQKAPELLKTIHPNSQRLLHVSSSTPVLFRATEIQSNDKHILEKTSMEITRDSFEEELQKHAKSLSVDIDPLLLHNEPSLLFMNSILPLSTLEDRERLQRFEKLNSHLLKDAIPCDFNDLGISVHPHIKTWTGSKFRKISAFAESRVVDKRFSVRKFDIPLFRTYCTHRSSRHGTSTEIFTLSMRRFIQGFTKQR